MRALLLILGALAGLALVGLGAVTAIDGMEGVSDVRIEETRTSIPGEREVGLEAGKHVVFYEVADDGEEQTPVVPALEVRVRRPGASRFLELDDYSGDFDVSGGGREAQAISTLEVPEDGRYEIAARGRTDATAPGVVLGHPITPRVLQLIAGVIGVVAGLGLIVLVAVLAIGWAVRTRPTGATP